MSTTVPDGRRLGSRGRGDRGSMAVEVVLMTPILVGFMLLVVAFGRAVAIRGEVEAASRDAVRAASLERNGADAEQAALALVRTAMTGRDCDALDLDWAGAGEVITVTVTCRVPLSDLGLIGLDRPWQVSASSAATLDLYRRSE